MTWKAKKAFCEAEQGEKNHMETGIVLLALIGITCFSFRGYLKRIRHGCCTAGMVCAKLRPEDRNPAHYPYIYEVKTEGMKCRNCAVSIENTFHEREGFLAKAGWKDARVTVRTKREVSREELEGILQKSGYRAVAVKELK